MSRTLRRPMFRGGRVSSYGTGIASGLADGGMAPDGRQKFFEGGVSTAMMNELTGGSNFRTGGNLLKSNMTPFQQGLYGQGGNLPNWMSRVGNFFKPGRITGMASRLRIRIFTTVICRCSKHVTRQSTRRITRRRWNR